MGLKGPEPVARIRAREGVAEVAKIVQQEAEIAELPQRSRNRLTIKEEEWKQSGTYPNQAIRTAPSRVNDVYPTGSDSGTKTVPSGPTGASGATRMTQAQRIPSIWTSSQDRSPFIDLTTSRSTSMEQPRGQAILRRSDPISV
ncbi:hypothetical protein F2Q69_00013002 [Brassica cretica]|uniref:Uncharacterized protein n=1 Tax=Brassica cretica TaxID=69181 RepID=A0A8S9QFW9_BRACR|nr:hypothetical protein F2Q69_00013002 [Brassica cretica]